MIFRTSLTASLETTNRLLALDLVKGFCIVLMVVAHSGSPEWLTSAIGLFHMPCFFVVSGFLFKESHLDNPGRFVRKRFRAFWWTFVFWTIVYVALHNLFYVCRFYEQSYTLRDSLAMVGRSLFMGGTEQLLGGFWFLSSLLFASLVAFVYYKWIGFGTRRILAGIIMLVACGELLLIAGVEVQTIHLNARDFFAAAYFMTGTLFARIEDGMRRRQIWTMTTAAVVLLAIQYGFHRCTISSLTPVNLLRFFFPCSPVLYQFHYCIVRSYTDFPHLGPQPRHPCACKDRQPHSRCAHIPLSCVQACCGSRCSCRRHVSRRASARVPGVCVRQSMDVGCIYGGGRGRVGACRRRHSRA